MHTGEDVFQSAPSLSQLSDFGSACFGTYKDEFQSAPSLSQLSDLVAQKLKFRLQEFQSAPSLSQLSDHTIQRGALFRGVSIRAQPFTAERLALHPLPYRDHEVSIRAQPFTAERHVSVMQSHA